MNKCFRMVFVKCTLAPYALGLEVLGFYKIVYIHFIL